MATMKAATNALPLKLAYLLMISLASGAVIEESKKCPNFCPLDQHPVCGSDGVTYVNLCLLEIARCDNPEIVMVSVGSCPPKVECPIGCPKNIEPVCGTDGKTYSNDCLLQVASCKNPSIQLDYVGPCDGACSMACPKIYKPVCGTNGKTYSNSCMLKAAACIDPSITSKHRGKCFVTLVSAIKL